MILRQRALRVVLAVTLLTPAGGTTAIAGQVTGPVGPAAGPELRPGEIQRLFDAYVLMEAQQALGLSDEQYAPFLTKLRALQDARRRHAAARAALLVDLARMTAPRAPRPADDVTLKRQLTALQDLDQQQALESRKAYSELDALLAPRQQARLRVFEDQLERRKLELMLRARQTARQERLQRR